MTRKEKSKVIEALVNKFRSYDYFYVVDAMTLSVEEIDDFRKKCFQEGVTYQVAKNTLVAKALQKVQNGLNYTYFIDTVLKGFSGIIFAQKMSRIPAMIIKEFRKKRNTDRPILKGALIDGALFLGEENLEALANMKTRIETLNEIAQLLQLSIRYGVTAMHHESCKLASAVKILALRESNS